MRIILLAMDPPIWWSGTSLAQCPECGIGVYTPFKTWSVNRKNPRSGKSVETILGMFECPECGQRFRAGAKNSTIKDLNVKMAAEKIKGIEGKLVNTLKNLREKLNTLESQRANLLLEIEELKKMAEGKAEALESEIGMLKEEIESLKQLLGVGEMDA